jgi:hypothetical protein
MEQEVRLIANFFLINWDKKKFIKLTYIFRAAKSHMNHIF